MNERLLWIPSLVSEEGDIGIPGHYEAFTPSMAATVLNMEMKGVKDFTDDDVAWEEYEKQERRATDAYYENVS
jgi:hypothetical protein